jgi:DNA-binding PadR family transcriptional regulator
MSRAEPIHSSVGAAEAPSASLPATAWAVLGLLSFGQELSGYGLKKWADSSLRFFYWSPAISQIYGELRRLETLGYVESRTTPQDDLRNKRLYRITDAGRTALAEWAHDAPVEPPVLKHSVLLRVWLGHLTGPERLRDAVNQHIADTDVILTELRAAREIAETTPDWKYPAIVERWGERYYESQRALAQELLDELERV